MSTASKLKSQFNTAPVRLIAIKDIQVGERLRSINDSEVTKLVESMMELGQLAPIVVRKTPRSDMAYALVAGLHRLQAAQKVGHSEIQATIREPMETPAAEMVEIAENLVRFDLKPAERIAHTKPWKELYEAAHPATKHGAVGRKGKSAQNEHSSAAKHIAEKTGRGESSVRRDATIAKKLGKGVLAKLKGSTLDRDDKLKALCELPPLIVEVLVTKAQADEKVSAKKRLVEWKKNEGAKSEPAAEPESASPVNTESAEVDDAKSKPAASAEREIHAVKAAGAALAGEPLMPAAEPPNAVVRHMVNQLMNLPDDQRLHVLCLVIKATMKGKSLDAQYDWAEAINSAACLNGWKHQ